MKYRSGFNSNFDREFNRTQRWILVSWVFFTALGIGFTGFIVWVIVKLLQFFGVV